MMTGGLSNSQRLKRDRSEDFIGKGIGGSRKVNGRSRLEINEKLEIPLEGEGGLFEGILKMM